MIWRTLPLLLGACSSATLAHASAADHVQADDAWIRVLPAGLPAGGFVTLRNDGAQAATVNKAESRVYDAVMLHASSIRGGVARMEPVSVIPIPAHGSVALTPGGYHLMLMNAKQPVQAGSQVHIVLHFNDGSTLDVPFMAKPAAAMK